MSNDVENIFIVYVCCGPKAECFRCFLSRSVFVELFVFFLAVFSRQPLSIPLKFPKVFCLQTSLSRARWRINQSEYHGGRSKRRLLASFFSYNYRLYAISLSPTKEPISGKAEIACT